MSLDIDLPSARRTGPPVSVAIGLPPSGRTGPPVDVVIGLLSTEERVLR
jgi:hypothetical protein